MTVMTVVRNDAGSRPDVLPLTAHSPVSVSEERRGLGGPLSRQAGATLRPVTVWVLLPPHHSITASRRSINHFCHGMSSRHIAFIISPALRPNS